MRGNPWRAGSLEGPELGAYVIVHTDSRRVEIDRRDASGVWRTEVIDEGDVSLPRGALAFAQIYARTALADAPSS